MMTLTASLQGISESAGMPRQSHCQAKRLLRFARNGYVVVFFTKLGLTINVDTSFPQRQELLSRAERLLVADAQPKPILLGRHLIEMGLTLGPDFGAIL